MKVSIRHGHGIPRNDDIKIPYGFGWDESDRKFGEGNGGKTLYIKDPSTNKPIEITDGLLKKEFLNYVFPISTNEDGTAESAVIDFQNGTTFSNTTFRFRKVIHPIDLSSYSALKLLTFD